MEAGDSPRLAVGGQSGAIVIETEGVCNRMTKCGDERVLAQGQWLLEHRDVDVFPYVHTLELEFTNSYEMERLSEIPWSLVRQDRLIEHAVSRLHQHVWSRPAEAVVDWPAHEAYVALRASQWLDHDDQESLIAWLWEIRTLEHETCLVHGDPTFSNMMLRGQELVFIDPIPADDRIPSIKEVDLGKILQSAIGYEATRFGLVKTCDTEDLLKLVPSGRRDVVVYFAMVHFLRLLPYAPDELVPEFKKVISDCLRHGWRTGRLPFSEP